jgi:peptide/nickel transport system ATP-binding protein
MEKRPLLEVRNLETAFSAQGPSSVKGISFSIRSGETVGLVGESGSGKSVTSFSIMRLLSRPGHIKNGEIIFSAKQAEDVNLAGAPEHQMTALRGNKIAMIFQEPMTSLNPVMRCGEQVTESIRRHTNLSAREARLKAIGLFSEVQLPEPELAYRKFPHQLSGGQKQRVMIAMAMSCEPELLIADEPTTALDVTVQKTILTLMKSLQQKHGMGILFITHDLGVIAEVADRVLVMYNGSIVEEGAVSDVFSSPRHPYTRGLLACRPPMNSRPDRLPVVSDFVSGRSKTPEFAQKSAATGPDKKILELRNVQTWFPSKKGIFGKPISFTRAVDDVSFNVYEGETLGLVGESGCGKTTLGRSILKLVPVTSGSIRYYDEDLLKMSERQFRPLRKDMQIIFQDPYSSLNPRVTVGEAIAEPLRVHRLQPNEKMVRARVNDLLVKVGLEPRHYQRYPHEFSGGQRQRVCIARALALNPRFVICDESVSALDVSVQAQVLNLLNDLKRDFGFTCIFISHDLSVVKYMSDRMVVMRKGKVEEIGNADEIYRNPSSDYTRTLIHSIPQLALEKLINNRHQA